MKFKLSRQMAVFGLQALVLLVLFLLAFRQIYSADLGFHLAAGRWIVDNLKFPDNDPFSYASLGKYVDVYWIFQITLWGIHQLSGEFGMVLWNALLVMVSFVLLWRRSVPDLKSTPWILPILFFLSALAIAPTLEIRPHTYSWIYFNLALFSLEKYRTCLNKKWTRWLPLLMVLWVNTHSMFILGIGVIGMFWLSNLLENKKPDMHLSLVLLLSVLACFINPYVEGGVLFPFELYGKISDPNLFSETITELKSPFTLDSYHSGGRFILFNQFFFIQLLFAVSVAGFFIQRKKLKLDEIFLFAVFSYLLFATAKNMGFFIFATLPVCYRGFIPILERTAEFFAEKYSPDEIRSLKITVFCLFAVWLGHVSKTIVTNEYYFNKAMPYRFGYKFDNLQLPEGAARFLIQNGLQGKLFNPLGFGGFLKFMLPQQIYIDGRLEVMTESVYREYLISQRSADAFGLLLARYGPQIVVLDYERQEIWQKFLMQSPEWRLAYFDEGAAVFLKNNYAINIAAVDAKNGLSFNAFAKALSEAKNTLDKTPDKPYFSKADSGEKERRLSVFHYKTGHLQQALYQGLQAIDQATSYFPVLYYNLGAYFYHAKLPAFSKMAYEKSGLYRDSLVVKMRLREMENAP